MKPAPIGANESERLQALINYQILDTPEETSFDDLTKLASAICGTPIAMVSLVDSNRQWFKSKVGVETKETARDISFCGHAIHQVDVFEIPDSSIDQRFFDNPLAVGAPQVRFYAGAPLITPNGHAIGTLCVIDHEPKHLNENQKTALMALARQVVSQLELRKAHEDLKIHYTNFKLLTAKLTQSAKLVGLGEMAAGIAHEINNPLAIIQALSAQLQMAASANKLNTEQLMKTAVKIESTVQRIAKITRGLRDFARDSGHEPFVPYSINKIIEETLDLCSARLKNISVDVCIGKMETELKISCRPVQIGQVLINLMNNAVDAVKDLDEKWIAIELSETEKFIELRFKDSGFGIPEDLRDRVMEPFFSTKPIGEGTGLGLSISKGIVESHGGQFFYDAHSRHTQFILQLPKAI